MSRQAHQVQNSRQGAFLNVVVNLFHVSYARDTYSSGLPLCSKKLKSFVVTKFDENLDRPLVEVVMLSDPYFTGTTDTFK